MIWGTVSHQFPALHCWPDAPDGPHEHLRNPHRHLFHVRIWIEQFHDERDVEYLEFKDWLSSVCTDRDMGRRSCERMAMDLRDLTRARWGEKRRVRVEVTEDGENGALIE